MSAQRVLGIDPATTTGWAVLQNGRHVSSGSIRFDSKTETQRYGQAHAFFIGLIDRWAPSVVAFEQVVRTHQSTRAANVYGGIVGCLMAAIWRVKPELEIRGIYPAVLKKFATGSGKAEKKAMIAAACRRWPGITILDDNHADALFLALAGGRS